MAIIGKTIDDFKNRNIMSSFVAKLLVSGAIDDVLCLDSKPHRLISRQRGKYISSENEQVVQISLPFLLKAP